MSDRYQNRDDLTDSLVRLDRRVLDCLVGLEDESTEVAYLPLYLPFASRKFVSRKEDESTEVAESASLYSPSTYP